MCELVPENVMLVPVPWTSVSGVTEPTARPSAGKSWAMPPAQSALVVIEPVAIAHLSVVIFHLLLDRPVLQVEGRGDHQEPCAARARWIEDEVRLFRHQDRRHLQYEIVAAADPRLSDGLARRKRIRGCQQFGQAFR